MSTKYPLGYRQPGEKPIEVRKSHASMTHACAGNGGPANDGNKVTINHRRHSGPCHQRRRQIHEGDEVTIANWTNKPHLTIHCSDCAARYLGAERTPCKSTAHSG